MYCPNCGKEIAEGAKFCPSCGCAVSDGNPNTAQPEPVADATQCGQAGARFGKSRLTYILLGWFFGLLGVHDFYAGYTGRGVAQLLLTILLGWLVVPLVIVWIWVLVEICVVRKDAAGRPFDR